jgi:hypothetical protein
MRPTNLTATPAGLAGTAWPLHLADSRGRVGPAAALGPEGGRLAPAASLRAPT